jgi:hypothetical protein
MFFIHKTAKYPYAPPAPPPNQSSAAAKENMNDATSDKSTHPDNDNKENLNKLIFNALHFTKN